MRYFGRLVMGLVVAACSGVLLTLAFPPYDLWPLVAVGFIPAIIAQHRIVPLRWSGLAYGMGIGAFFWGYFGPMFAGTVWFMEWLPLIVAVVATLASGGNRIFHERMGYRWFVLEGAVVWVAIEAIRGFAPVIGTGGFVAYALYSQPWLLQPVGIFSIYGLSLLILLVNYALALGILAWLDGRTAPAPGQVSVPRPRAQRWMAGVGAGVVAWTALSVALLGQAAVPGAAVRVAAIQPGGSADTAGELQHLMAQTRDAAGQGAQLVIWPEGAVYFDPRLDHTGELQGLARETGVYLALGYAVPLAQGWRNEATVIAPDGTFLGTYGKDHPVVWLGETSLTRGTYPTYATPWGRLGTIICYDLNFTDTARKIAGNGAGIIAVPSNDWSSLADRQYTSLVLRAVENRVSLVKADGRYDSAVIDPTGRIVSLGLSSQGQQTTLVASVAPGAANAPLIWLGDWVGWLAVAGMIVFMGLGMLTTRRARTGTRRVPATVGATTG